MTKSFMSYVDLKKAALKDDLECGGGLESELEMASGDENLRLFFEEAGLVKEEMASIRGLLTSLQEANEEGKSLHKSEAIRSMRDHINSDINQVANWIFFHFSFLQSRGCLTTFP
jgi:syntaxin 1B/2/3